MADAAFSAEVAGGVIRGVRAGSGDPLLVLHGGPGMSDYTAMFASELAGWDVVRYTQRGTAPSSAEGPFTAAGHVCDALAVLDHLGIDETVVLGHSWGGYLAVRLAAAAPDRVRGLVVVDGLGAADDGGLEAFGANMVARSSPEALAKVAESDERAAAATGAAERDACALEGLRQMWPAYFADPAAAPPPPDDLRLSHECYLQTMASVIAERSGGQVASQLAGYAGPVEILAGTGGPMPAQVSQATAALFSDARVTELPQAGHFTWHECPGSVSEALARLAARLGS